MDLLFAYLDPLFVLGMFIGGATFALAGIFMPVGLLYTLFVVEKDSKSEILLASLFPIILYAGIWTLHHFFGDAATNLMCG